MELIEYNGIEYIVIYPGEGPRSKIDMSRPQWTHNGASCVQIYTVWKHDWKHKNLDIGELDCAKVWKWVPSVWDGLDMDIFRPGHCGDIGLRSGTSAWVAISENFFYFQLFQAYYDPKICANIIVRLGFGQWELHLSGSVTHTPFSLPWKGGERCLFLLRWPQKWANVWLVQKTRCLCGTVLDLEGISLQKKKALLQNEMSRGLLTYKSGHNTTTAHITEFFDGFHYLPGTLNFIMGENWLNECSRGWKVYHFYWIGEFGN